MDKSEFYSPVDSLLLKDEYFDLQKETARARNANPHNEAESEDDGERIYRQTLREQNPRAAQEAYGKELAVKLRNDERQREIAKILAERSSRGHKGIFDPNREVDIPDDYDYEEGLTEKEKKKLAAAMEAVGITPPKKDGVFTEFGQAFAGSALDVARGFGSTIEETTGYSGMREYIDEVKSRNRQYDPYEGYTAASLDPVDIARTVGSGVAQSTLSLAAGAVTTAATGGNAFAGASVMGSIMFGQIYGDRVKDYRERMPDQDENTVRGLAFASAVGESLIEVALGPEALARGIAKKWVTGALKDTTKGLVKTMGAEAAKNFLTEGSEEVMQDLWDRICLRAGTENVTLPSWDEVKETFMGGAWSGLVLGGAGGAVEHMGSRRGGQNGNPSSPVGEAAASDGRYGPPLPNLKGEAVPGAGAKADMMGAKPEGVLPTPDESQVKAEHSVSSRLAEAVANEIGLNLRFLDEEGAPEAVDDKGNPVSGWYDDEKNEYWIDRKDLEANPLKTLGHEFKHFLDLKHPDLAKQFDELVKAGMNEKGKQALSDVEAEYQEGGYAPGQGNAEFSADTMGELWLDPDHWRNFTARADKQELGLGEKFLEAVQEFIKIVRAKLKEIGTPEAKEMFDNFGALKKKSEEILLEVKRRNGTSTEAENVVGVKGSDTVQSIPLSELGIDPARFQFKSKANKETGVDESNQIGGEWDPKTAGNLYVWEDKDGKKFVVNGHHRYQLAKEKGVEKVNAIVDREADGVTAEQARRNGVLINIRDEQGDVRDYAEFVRHEKMDEETAAKEGVLNREKGKRGFLIGRYASDNLYSLYRNGEIGDAKASTIADVARGDESLEAAGIRAAKTMPNAQLAEFLKCLKTMPRVETEHGDLFGFDDSALQTAEKLSKLAAKHIREIDEKLRAVKQAIRNPETAAKGDVKVGKNAQKIYDQTLRDKAEWEHWYTNPELSAQLRKEAGIEEDAGSGDASSRGTRDTRSSIEDAGAGVASRDDADAGRFNMDSETPLLSDAEDANDFQLTAETPAEAAARDRAAEREKEEKRARADKEAERKAPELAFGNDERGSSSSAKAMEDMGRGGQAGEREADVKENLTTEAEAGPKDIYGKIREAKEGSPARVQAFLELPDGEHELGGKKFTKVGNIFERDGQKLNARGIEKSFRGVDLSGGADNIYLRMPLDRVRADAENGVKLAQDALNQLEKRGTAEYGKDTTKKEQSDDTSTATHLERRGEVRDAENRADEKAVLDDGRGNGDVSGRGIGRTGSARVREEGRAVDAAAAPESDGTGSREVDGGELSGDRAGAADRGRAGGRDEHRDRGIRSGDEGRGGRAGEGTAGETDRKPRSQDEADRIKVKERDRGNIAETLPTLYSEQCDDVLKAEKRYSNGKGMLFTNATGTGKTFTGLGIIKRFFRQGKQNILIVTPTDKKNRDWVSDAKNVNLEVKQLSGVGDNGGTGIVVTTYANFRQNQSLLRRVWDLLVFDESHKISSAEGKVDTLAKQQLDQLAGVREIALRRAFEENKELLQRELGKIDPKYQQYELERIEGSKKPVLLFSDLQNHFDELPEAIQKKLKDREAELSKSKVLFLSATPFSYHQSLLYADGYLFDISREKGNGGYNSPDGEQKFFIENFGYRMRYGKLTKPDADVDVGVMERAFYEKLRKSGAVSGRMLEIDKDYSREFFRVQSDLGEQIQAGMDILNDYRQYPAINSLIHKIHDYNYVTSLLECLKAKATAEAIKKDIAAGRKVVVFHNRNTGTPDHPFRLGKLYNYVGSEHQHQELKKEIERFEVDHPELVNLKLNDLQNPIDYFRRVFGEKALFFDGTISAKKRAQNVEEFNDAKSGKNLIVVQIEAGKEGISLHDKKGDAQRVLYNLGLPTKPTDLIQSEGRIYRLGSKSNAIFRYPVTGLPMERYAFGSKINQRASTAENLGMGDAARDLRDALREGYMGAGEALPFEQQGVGGKAYDRGFDSVSDFDRAKTYYFGQLKRNSKTKSAEGVDYFATPEPIGYKMVEWAGLKPGDRVLEPSAGHGAIARFFPDTVDAKAIEPSGDLSSKLTVNTTAKVIRGNFEDHSYYNKYNCVLMNPPFGVGGKTAIEHLTKAFEDHLSQFGRIIAILPEGGMADKRFEAFMNSHDEAHLTAEIGLPGVTFQRAGTSVKTKIVVIDKSVSYLAGNLPEAQQRIDIEAENINELFSKIENLTVPPRAGYDSGRQYSLKRTKEVSNMAPSGISDEQEREIREAYDYVMNGEPVAHLTGKEFQKDGIPLTEKVTRFYQEQYNGKAIHPELGEVKLDLEGVKDSLGHGIGSVKAAAYAAVPQIIEKGKIFDRQKNWKDRGYDTVVMAAPLEIGGVPYVGEVIVKQGADRQGFYLHEVEVKEKLADVFKTANGSTSPVSRLIISHLIEKVKKKKDWEANFSENEAEKDYSLKRHRQVNPIREAGEVQSEHADRINEFYEVRGNAEVNRRAERRIKGMGGFGETIRMMLDGDFAVGSDVSQRILQLVLNSDEFKALDAADREKISDIYIKFGMEVGRSLAARRLGALDVEDIKSIQAHVNAFMAKLDKAKPKNDLRQEILDEFGVDIDNLPEDLVNDPDKLDEILREMMAKRASVGDKLYEFWINSILSGPATHAANTLGNAANAAYELGVKRLAEAAVNTVLKKKDAATFGEFKEMYKAVDWRGAWDRAVRAFKYEALTTSGKLDRARAAIGGKLGRAIRYPSRFLRAADEFAKAIVQPMEAAAEAYREGTSGGLKGNDLRDYIANQVMDPESAANRFGRKRALELTFQEEPGKAINALINWREDGSLFGTLLKFELPFIKTPANILRQGIRKSPLGAVNLAWQTGKALAGKRKIDSEYISLAAEQILAWGAVAMIAGMDDDDDDMPFLTGTSPRYGSAEQKFKANKVPPYSIRIGGNYYSYKRIEPLATGLAFIADGLDAFKRAKRGEDGTRIMKRLIKGTMIQLVAEKSFLDSLGEINRIYSDPERSVAKAATNFVSSWMPNAVRQTVNLFDDNVRDSKSRAKGEEWFKDQFRITTNRMGITKGTPKLDYFGQEITKDSLADSGPLWQLMRIVPIQSVSPDDNMNRAERLMWQYNQDHPEEEYYPDVPAYYFQRDGKKLYMSGDDYQDFVRESGQLALKQINNAFRHGLLDERRPTEKDIELIKKIFSRARKEVRDKMYRKGQYSE